ncbi:malate oxidoreductase [Bifidobacterium dolichotidis]|uniref:Malate oxidoreductase n=1 Tax=Bifidobacterium dolichotidis TaxID=2306976 RepID=A0A430FQW4_9BIFI|nr:NAD-dependent malic enzyme [Bifidobacterium dolichotidis]RSX55211.1 malate oxidoreductase [Bifidobacterium dolichotidis]
MKLPDIMRNPFTNKGTAFTLEERKQYGLAGLLPSAVETLDDQERRAYEQYNNCESNLQKYLMLSDLRNANATLYYRVVTEHLAEMLPIIYDPTIAEAIEKWSDDFRDAPALYLSVDHIDQIDEAFDNLGLGPDDVDLLVVSDAEQILGIGDWGVNGTEISIGKLAVYTAAAGVDPRRVVAVGLDAGTDNEALLNNPKYLGNRHARVRGEQYDRMIAEYLRSAAAHFPHAMLHFEDFGASNARRILEQYRDQYRIFNDDMQGTGAIVMAAVMSGLKITHSTFADQRLVVFGAGTAGSGMADQIAAAMVREGLSEDEAKARVWLVDINGLVTDDMKNLPNYQQPYARPAAEVADWKRDENGHIKLLEVIKHVHPTILIGTSTDHGAFTEDVIREMAAGTERPIVLPLSNPTEKIEAMPDDIIRWSDGRALISTGIPIDPVEYNGVTYHIGQANNALLYPGLGLGVIISAAEHITDGMLLAAANAAAGQVDVMTPGASLLPAVENLRESSATVAVAVAMQAVKDGVAEDLYAQAVHDGKADGRTEKDFWIERVHAMMWQPEYK